MHRGLVMGIAAVLVLGSPIVARAARDRGSEEPFATLVVTSDNVEVLRAEGKRFKPARDGQSLREGDTVRTDATGRAEIHYAEDSFTRLDVSTTFTVVELTDDEGNRTVLGDQESGRTWNRVEALAETETFEVQGAGAVAAVQGTAFAVDCGDEDACTFLAVVHATLVTGVDGEQLLGPANAVGALDGHLGELVTRSLEQLVGNDWVQANLLLDLADGIGPGPFVAAAAPSAGGSTGTGGSSGSPSSGGGSTSGTTGGSTGGSTGGAVKPGCGFGDKSPHSGSAPGCK